MGSRKREAARKDRQGQTENGMANVKVKGENFYRNAKKIKVLNMFKSGKAVHNAAGKVTKAAAHQSHDKPIARVEPHRKWFTNSRVISQQSLEAFRGAVAEQSQDPYSYLLKQNKLPMSLIRDGDGKNGVKQHQAKMAIQASSFSETFGPKAQRKRVKLSVSSVDEMAKQATQMHDDYLDRLEEKRLLSGNAGADADEDMEDEAEDAPSSTAREPIFSKGQSKRIFNELYRVIDSSDVVVHVLDARDPLGTRCRSVEKYMREEVPHKHHMFILNKCDLVPTKVAATWVAILSKEYPTLAFRSSIQNSFGKGSLIQVLRQFSALHSDRKQISVGFIGYPNTGKSSIINTLRAKKVCTVAPIPGETKVWQYVTLMKRIYLIDCPGIVPPSIHDSAEDLLLRGSVRVEKVENPSEYVFAALRRCRPRHIERTYDIRQYTEPMAFLEELARKSGRLLKGGEPDLDGVAKIVLNDFLRGKLPWYEPPPAGDGVRQSGVEGRQGRLGEMGPRSMPEEESGDIPDEEVDLSDDESGEDEEEGPSFEGFEEDDEKAGSNIGLVEDSYGGG